MNVALLPLGKRVIVQRVEAPSTTPGVATISDSFKPKEGTVIAVGPQFGGCCYPDRKLMPGDRVLFTKYVGTELPEEFGSNLLELDEMEILAIVCRKEEPDAKKNV